MKPWTIAARIAAFLTACLTICLTTSSAHADETAFVWGNKPGASNYTPSDAYRYNPAGEPVTIERKGTGKYQVRFAGLGPQAAGGNVQVTAYGRGPEHCKVQQWTRSGDDLLIIALCFSGTRAADSQFSLLFTPKGSQPQSNAAPPPPPPPAAPRLRFERGDQTPLAGNPRGGSAYRDTCPEGAAITGVQMRVAGSLEAIQVTCRQLALDPAGRAASPRRATLTTLRGRPRGRSARLDCPNGQVVVGFTGRSGRLVDSLGLMCATVRFDAGGAPRLDGRRSTRTIGGSGGKPFPARRCRGRAIATTAVIRAGHSVDAFGLGCSQARVERR